MKIQCNDIYTNNYMKELKFLLDATKEKGVT